MSLQTIAYGTMQPNETNEFISRHIFPDAALPQPHEIVEAASGSFELTLLRNDRLRVTGRTCDLWYQNLRRRRGEAVAAVGEEKVAQYEKYLRLSTFGFRSGKRVVTYRLSASCLITKIEKFIAQAPRPRLRSVRKVTGSRCLLPARRLSLPAAVDRRRIVWLYASTVGLCHLIALLAVLPWFFSWSGLALTFAGIYVFGGLGINLGYHRLLTHRGLICPKWLEWRLAVLGVCCMQDTPARWAAVHQRHHEHADDKDDPHSPVG